MSCVSVSPRGIDFTGYASASSWSTAQWAIKNPERRRRQQLAYYTKNKEKIKLQRRMRYHRKKAILEEEENM